MPLGDNYIEENVGPARQSSPFLAPPVQANIPENLEWMRKFYKELSEDMIKRLSRMIRKTMQPLYQFPPFYHIVIDRLDMAQVNIGQTGTILTLTIPQNEYARIRFYGQDITPVVAPLPGTEWNEVNWSFNVNGVPLEDYDNFIYQRGAQLFPAETTIILDGADVFTITATNNSITDNYFLWAFIRGWRWSKLTTDRPDEDLLED